MKKTIILLFILLQTFFVNAYSDNSQYNSKLAVIETKISKLNEKQLKYLIDYINKNKQKLNNIYIDEILKISENQYKNIIDEKYKNLSYKFRDKYDVVYNFTWGLAKVWLWVDFWFINETGKIIIPIKYNVIHEQDWVIVACDDIDMRNNYKEMHYEKNCWVYDYNWKILIPFNNKAISNFSNWYACYYEVAWNRCSSIIDKTWKTIIDFKNYNWKYKNEKWHKFDFSENVFTHPAPFSFNDWLIRIYSSLQFWYMNIKWEIIYAINQNSSIWVRNFNEWLAFVVWVWYINTDWKVVIPWENSEYNLNRSDFKEWLGRVQLKWDKYWLSSKIWFIDTTWKLIIKTDVYDTFTWDNAIDRYTFNEWLIPLCDKEKCEYIDKIWRVILSDVGKTYKLLWRKFSNGYTPINTKEGLWYIDKNWNILINSKIKWNYLSDFIDWVAKVRIDLNKEWYLYLDWFLKEIK